MGYLCLNFLISCIKLLFIICFVYEMFLSHIFLSKAFDSKTICTTVWYFKYETILTKRNKRQRKRDMIIFNPPFSLTVSYKIGKQFLILIKTSFDEKYTYKKYSIATQLKYHTVVQVILERITIVPQNNKILNKNNTNYKSNTKDKLCNCRRKPLNNQLL